MSDNKTQTPNQANIELLKQRRDEQIQKYLDALHQIQIIHMKIFIEETIQLIIFCFACLFIFILSPFSYYTAILSAIYVICKIFSNFIIKKTLTNQKRQPKP